MKQHLKILFLPQNIASMPAITADNLANKKNISAKCLTLSIHKYQESGENIIVLPQPASKRTPFKWLWYKLTFKRKIYQWIKWADIVHYTWTPIFSDESDVKFAVEKKKKIFVEWLGSDIRNPDLLKRINPFYKYAFENGYEYAAFESGEQSLKNQTTFSKYHAIPLLCAEMQLFLNNSLFQQSHLVYQRINCKAFVPDYPQIEKTKPLIIHSPSAKIAKGSNIILPIIEELKQDYDFEFMILHDISREKVHEVMQKADIFIDQIIIGSYGMASMEAMSFGKPVMCYIMPEVFAAGLSKECPIVNTNPDNLKDQLIKLINDPQLRNAIGKKSRAFIEKYHDVEQVTEQLLTVYKNELNKETNNV